MVNVQQKIHMLVIFVFSNCDVPLAKNKPKNTTNCVEDNHYNKDNSPTLCQI